MHKIGWNLRAPSQIEDARQRVNVENPADEHGEEGDGDERGHPNVVSEREHGNADVWKDKVLWKKVEQFEKGLRGQATFRRQVVECVMRLANTAKQYSHDPCNENESIKCDVSFVYGRLLRFCDVSNQ